MPVTPPDTIRRYTLFVSSANDAKKLRARIERLVNVVFRPVLAEAGFPFDIYVDKWEHSVPRRTYGRRVNYEFVEKALNSDTTLALLGDHLGAGTKEELEALLAEVDGPQLSVLRFKGLPPLDHPLEATEDFCRRYREDELLYGQEVGADTEGGWFELMKAVFFMTARIARRELPSSGWLMTSREKIDFYHEVRP